MLSFSERVLIGDVLSGNGIIIQQVNCRGVMGAGLASQVRRAYPKVYNEYMKLCRSKSAEQLLGGVLYVTVSKDKVIANVFGQNTYGRTGVHTDYYALEKGLKNVAKNAQKHNLSVHLPFGLGCGLAGGDWSIVSSIIASVFSDVEYYIYRLE